MRELALISNNTHNIHTNLQFSYVQNALMDVSDIAVRSTAIAGMSPISVEKRTGIVYLDAALDSTHNLGAKQVKIFRLNIT